MALIPIGVEQVEFLSVLMKEVPNIYPGLKMNLKNYYECKYEHDPFRVYAVYCFFVNCI